MMLDNVNDFKPTKVLVLFYIWYDEFGVWYFQLYLVIYLVYFSLTRRCFSFTRSLRGRVVPHDKQQ